MQAEDGIVFEIQTPYDESLPISVDYLRANTLDPDLLPLPGEFLTLETETLPALESIEQKARQTNREFLKLSLGFTNQLRTEMPARILGQILKSVQKVIYNIGVSLEGNDRASIGLREKMELSVVGVGAGSFEVELASSQLVDLFGESEVGYAISEFIDLLNIGNDHDSLQAKISLLKKRVAGAYLDFLKSIEGVVFDTSLSWASPNQERNKSGRISDSIVQSVIDTIKELEDISEQDYEIVGKFVAISLRRKRFEIASTTSNDTYSGDISDEAFSDISNATLGRKYYVTLREIHQRNIISDNAVTKYQLLDLIPHTIHDPIT